MCKPQVCFSAIIIQSLQTTVITGLIFLRRPRLSISFFLSLLQLLPYLAPNLTVSSCVSLGSVSTPVFSIICSWTPSRSQICYLFMPKHLGLDTVLSLQRGKLEKTPTGSQLAGCSIPTSQGGVSMEREKAGGRDVGGSGDPGGARSSHSHVVAFRGTQ